MRDDRPSSLAMDRALPLVSVVVPCFNAGAMLRPAMLSVIEQSYPNIEIIFVNNNSTDGSAEVASELARDTDVADRPIRIFQGTADDYDPIGPCKAFVGRLRAAGRDIEITEYPNASHYFDNPLGGAIPLVAKNAQTVRHCTISEEPEGVLINAVTN